MPVDTTTLAEPLATVIRETASAKKNHLAAFKASAKKRGLKNADDLLKAARDVDVNATPANSPQRFKLYSGDDALDPLPPVGYVVEGVFAEGSVNLIVGEPGSKKTFTMLDCGVSVSIAEKWLNFQTRKSVVLIIDEESGERRLKRRLAGVMRGHSIPKGKAKIFCTSLSGLELIRQGEQDALLQLVKDTGAKFVLIDALIDTLIGADENAASDIQTVFRGLRKIAEETRAAIIVIHHVNKNGGYRGSSAMNGAIDLMLKVESKRDSPNIDFKSEKTRDIEPFAFAAIANFHPDETFNLSPSTPSIPEDHHSDSENYVLEFLKKCDATIGEIEANANVCSSAAARGATYRLAKTGKIERKNTGAKGVPAIYGLKRKIP
jgi:hypothetical protein